MYYLNVASYLCHREREKKRLKECSHTLTPWAPIGGNAPALGIGPTRGLFVGGGRDPLAAVGLQE